LLSIGGAGEGSTAFAEVASQSGTRSHFASSARAIVDTYKLDGIDSMSNMPRKKEVADL